MYIYVFVLLVATVISMFLHVYEAIGFEEYMHTDMLRCTTIDVRITLHATAIIILLRIKIRCYAKKRF